MFIIRTWFWFREAVAKVAIHAGVAMDTKGNITDIEQSLASLVCLLFIANLKSIALPISQYESKSEKIETFI